MPKRAEGYRNLSELTEQEKDAIIERYYKKDMTVKDLARFYKLTNRTLPALFKEKGIDSHKKNRYSLNEHYFDKIDTEKKLIGLDICMQTALSEIPILTILFLFKNNQMDMLLNNLQTI